MKYVSSFATAWRVVCLLLLYALNDRGSLAQTAPPAPAAALAPTSAAPGNSTPASSTQPPEQTTNPSIAPAEVRPKDEVATHDTPATFKVRVNLVQIRVVVRDEKGNLLPDLHREDFQIFDGRKPQLLSTFNVETTEPRSGPAAASAMPENVEMEKAAVLAKMPQRFVSMVFDDIHFSLEDATFVRSAGTKFLDSLAPSDRVGIYSTSGQFTQEFTDDHEALKKALLKVLPHSVTANGYHNCPDVSYYLADQVENQRNTQALAVATEMAVQCAFNGDETKAAQAQPLAQAAVFQALSTGDAESTYAYSHLSDITRRLSAMPGQRIMVFVSPGFIPSTLWPEMTELIDRANRSSITINTIDGRGLYTPDVLGDIADPPRFSPKTAGFETSYRVQAQFAQEEVLADLALGTGGTFFHNRNDIEEGMKQAGAAPGVSYVLGFSPQNLKYDGRFHEIKVVLTNKRKAEIQARRGYYAPRTIPDPAAAAKADIEEAMFSQDEISELPIELQTQFFKKDANDARLAVLTHFDLKGVHFRKAEGRSNDDVTIATAIFDQNGNFVIGGEKILEMKLLDNTYEKLSRTGLTVKSSFDVKPGTYMVRQVVRDGEGAQMAARNGAVVIPF
jgi:VWFA-related protein